MTFKHGEKIRENRQLAKVETVFRHIENFVETYEGNVYHVTKIVRA